jgi:hypothetical protein
VALVAVVLGAAAATPVSLGRGRCAYFDENEFVGTERKRLAIAGRGGRC